MDDNVEKVMALVRSGCLIVHQYLTLDLGMKQSARQDGYKKNLAEQNTNRRDVCLDHLNHRKRTRDFFSRVIKGSRSGKEAQGGNFFSLFTSLFFFLLFLFACARQRFRNSTFNVTV